MAGRPSFFKTRKSKDKPAFTSITIKAISFISADRFKILSSIKFKKYGPKITPVMIKPTYLGNFIFSKIAASVMPTKNISAIDISI